MGSAYGFGGIGKIIGPVGLALIVGSGKHIEDVAHALSSGGGDNINVIGFLSLEPRPHNGLISLGTLDDLGDIVLAHRVSRLPGLTSEGRKPVAVRIVTSTANMPSTATT